MHTESQDQFPDFTIPRLGPAEIESPLAQCYSEDSRFFVSDDERALYDTIGQASSHGAMPTQIDAINLEVAGPRRKLFFDPKQVKAAIVTCGGLCPGLNNVIRSLVLSLHQLYSVQHVEGVRFGYAGMIEGGHLPIALNPEVVDTLHLQGGTFLGSSRGHQDIEAMLRFLKTRGINILFTIGGDGTQRCASILSQSAMKMGYRLSVIGLPKTIDNDLEYVDRSFGFETAFSLADQALRAAYAEAKGVINGVGMVKLMGRHSGYITALSSLAHCQVNFVLVPEVPFDIHGPRGFVSCLGRHLSRHQFALVAIAEGAGQHLLAEEAKRLGTDSSGNQKLADVGVAIRLAIESYGKAENIPINVRYIDPSYMIRSAVATPNDSVFCLQLAQHAVHAAMAGRTAMMVGIWKNTFTHVPMAAAIARKKQIDPCSSIWLSVLQTTNQPAHMVN